MKKLTSTLLSATVALTLLGSYATANSGVQWGYTGHGSPSSWGELSEKYKMCNEGKNQSPINVISSLDADLASLNLSYSHASKEVINNGHTIQVNIDSGDKMVVDGIEFELKQFHFHTPSENHINDKSYPLEAHYVHLDKNGNIAVLGLMFEEGKENTILSKIWDKMPKNAGEKVSLSIANIATALLPKEKEYYRFNGSLTTPPCSEGVRWLLLKTPVSISKEQVTKFLHIMHHPNNRPVQPTNARVIIK